MCIREALALSFCMVNMLCHLNTDSSSYLNEDTVADVTKLVLGYMFLTSFFCMVLDII